jgi:hypothetical protein
MDTYLEIAEKVLRQVRRPLSALQILRSAYELGFAPPHLKGRTQQKTMGARLSEDILHHREGSRFYRTAPGRFLLRELADAPDIPEELRQPIVARRRRRDLVQKRSLAFDWQALVEATGPEIVIDYNVVLDLISDGDFHYTSSAGDRPAEDVVVWAFVVVMKPGHVLSYRQGHYREDRDAFVQRRTIGFYTPVIDRDLSLFDRADHGIVSSGIKALATDLDLQDRSVWSALVDNSELRVFVCPEAEQVRDLLAVVAFACPDWLDPTSKRLAINDLEWLDVRSPPNHREDFDPWSQAILFDARETSIGSG